MVEDHIAANGLVTGVVMSRVPIMTVATSTH
jgi:hypothetical protein